MKRRPSPESFLPLKPNWFHVLLSLAGGEQHGYGIMQEVLDRTDGKVRLWPATLYGTLKRLIESGVLVTEMRQLNNPLQDLFEGTHSQRPNKTDGRDENRN